jgi:hypothetical protein
VSDNDDKKPPAPSGAGSTAPHKSSGGVPASGQTSGRTAAPLPGLEMTARETSDKQAPPGSTSKADKPAVKKSGPRSRPSPETNAPKRSASRWFVAALILLVLIGGAYISWPFWGPKLPDGVRTVLAPVMNKGRGSADGKALAAIDNRIASLEKSLAVTRAALGSVRAEDAAKLAGEIRKIETKIQAIGETASLAKRLGDLEQRFARRAIEQRAAASAVASVAANRGNSPEAAALAVAGRQTASKVATLEAANTELRGQLATLNTRLAAMENRPVAVATGPGPANALLLAIGQLREASRGAASFEPAYKAVAALSGKDKNIVKSLAALAAHQKGVADLPDLRRQFAAAASAIVRATIVPRGDSWLDRTLDGVASLVSIRKTGEKAAAADDVQGLVARAELRLSSGDLAGTVKALDGLKGSPADAAKSWLEAARARRAVEDAVDALMRAALVRAKS